MLNFQEARGIYTTTHYCLFRSNLELGKWKIFISIRSIGQLYAREKLLYPKTEAFTSASQTPVKLFSNEALKENYN